jgi:hypothetical protein
MVERDVMGLASKLFHIVAVHSELSLVELIDGRWLITIEFKLIAQKDNKPCAFCHSKRSI